MTHPILVTGASGPLGRQVITELLKRNVSAADIIATTRTPDRLADLSSLGVSIREADFDHQTGLREAFTGAHTVLIVSTDRLDLGGSARIGQHERAVAAAVAAGARHLAYTSMIRPEPGSPFLLAQEHHASERALQASGLSHTIFRNNAYFENLLRSLPGAVASGVLMTSAGEGRVAYASRDDIAASIAGRLATRPTDTVILDITGPVAFSSGELAALVQTTTGRDIRVENVSDEALHRALLGAGVPAQFAELAVSGEANVRAGNAAITSDVIRELSGKEPLKLVQFLQANATALTA